EVTLQVPKDVRAGDPLKLAWTGAVSGNDYVTIVPMGTEEGVRETHVRVRDRSADELRAPEAPGLYEVRYVLDEGDRTLARAPVEVLAEDAPLERGARLTAPDTAEAGSRIEVGWQAEGESADRRVTLAREGQALFTWIVAVPAEEPTVAIDLPDEPGAYELRFIDVEAGEVLARRSLVLR
ncbi:hypothetical protein DRV85_16820, partial [Rhodosalinus halophilus]